MFDVMACYGDYIHLSVASVPPPEEPSNNKNKCGKRHLQHDKDVLSASESPKQPCLTPVTPQVASVFLHHDVAPLPIAKPPVSEINPRWPHKHAGVFSDEGGVQKYISSLKKIKDNNESLPKGKEAAGCLLP